MRNVLVFAILTAVVPSAYADLVLAKADAAIRRERKLAPDVLVAAVKREIAAQIDKNNWDFSFGAHWRSLTADDGRPVVPRLVTHTDPASLQMDTNIYDDEIGNVELVMRLERAFGIEIPDEEAEAIFETDPTVGRLVACVRKHLREDKRP